MKDASLRERKKTETRAAIIKATFDLFRSKGYAGTTLADIADAANVSQRTIFSYFSSKEAIIFYEDQSHIEHIINRLKSRGDRSVLDVISERIEEHHAFVHNPERRKQRALIKDTPALQEYFGRMLLSLEEGFTSAIAEEYNIEANSLRAHIAASVYRSAVHYHVSHPDTADKQSFAKTVVLFVEAGLNATKETNPKSH